VPLVTENDVVNGPPPAQATRQQVHDFVVAELQAIQNDLPAAGASNYGRASGPAASLLLAEIYLNDSVYVGTGNYAGALAAAQAVIGSGAYSLDASFQHMFLADNNTSPEIIFPITQDGLKTQTYGGVTFLAHASCGGSMSNSSYGIDGCWWGIRLKPEAFNRFDSTDTRAGFFFKTGQTVAVSAINDFTKGIAAPKFQNVTSSAQPGSNGTFVDTDFPLFRLADAYLIYAEAVLRGGGGTRAQALDYVNQLRVRAYGDSTGVIADSQLTLPFLLAERGRELLWEAHRRTDLVRFGLFTGGSYIWAWKGGTEAGGSTDAHLNLYPIPASELVANPNLHQNPGY